MRKDIKQLFTELTINPAIPFWGLLRRVSPLITSDIIYIKIAYYIKFGRRLNIKRPETFNEKLQWLKINYRKQFFTDMADKYSAKQYAERIIGKQYIVPCYGTWTQAEQIDFDTLPNTFVLKCTHNSGAGTFICKDKNNINVFKIQKDLKKALKTNHYYLWREWPYKNIRPRIIAEEYLDDGTGNMLTDYKWLCFNGKPKIMYITNKSNQITENFYDMDFNPIYLDRGYPRHKPEFEKPSEFDTMKKLAEELAQSLPFIRIDFFDINGHVYFSEFTFYDWGGGLPFTDINNDIMLGNMISLPK